MLDLKIAEVREQLAGVRATLYVKGREVDDLARMERQLNEALAALESVAAAEHQALEETRQLVLRQSQAPAPTAQGPAP